MIIELVDAIKGIFEPDEPEAVQKQKDPDVAEQTNRIDPASEKLIFPYNRTERYGASILFTAYETHSPGLYADPKGKELLLAQGKSTAAKKDEIYKDHADDQRQRETALAKLKKDDEKKRQEIIADNSTFRMPDGAGEASSPAIKLYLPPSLTQADGFSFAQPELGAIGAGIENSLTGGGSLLGSLGKAAKDGIQSITDFATGGLSGPQASLAMTKMAGRLGKAGGVGTEAGAAAALVGGVVVNPNVRALFKGVNLREFTFQFKFIAKSRREAEEVEKIIKMFRSCAYPESIDVGGISAGYKFPHRFEIDIMYNDKVRIGNKMKKCYLKSISTTYNASSMAFHSDGKPVEIDVSLSFMEERTLTRADIIEEDGY